MALFQFVCDGGKIGYVSVSSQRWSARLDVERSPAAALERGMSIYDKDTGEELTSPRGFPKLYNKVTHLHKDYLRALAALGKEWVNYHQWTSQCQVMGVETHQGTPPERLSPTMIYGVFECRGYIQVQKDEKTKLNLYRLTNKGKGYLEGLLSQN